MGLALVNDEDELFWHDFHLLPSSIDFGLLVEVDVVGGDGLGRPAPLNEQCSQEKFQVVKTFRCQFEHHVQFEYLRRFQMRAAHPYILVVPNLAGVVVMPQFLHFYRLVGFDIKRKDDLLADGHVAVQQAAAECVSEYLGYAEQAAHVEVDVFYRGVGRF